ncbi:MAG: tetratricopeptide repeat protein, partial [Cyclobacteriaceae bacterium]|nr:tetratricopeptide repeat protein [Cyclobacteriaceae bacterium]
MESPLTVSEIPDWLKKAYELRINDVKKSFLLTEQALQVSQENKNESFTAQSLCQLSLLNMIIGDYETCQVQAEKAIDIFKKQGDEKGVADAKYNLAGIYYKTDKFHLGLTYLLDCQSIYKKLGDHHNMSRTLKSMGTIYEYFGDENSAIRSYGDAIDAAIQAHDPNLESNAYNPLSGIHLNNGDQKKARDLIEKAIAIKQKSGDLRGLAFSLYGRGKVNTKSGNFLEAEKDFTEAIKIHQDMNEHLGIGMCYYKLGELYFDMGENKNAIKTLKAAQKISVKFNNALITFKSNRLLYLIYKKENKTKKALFFLEKYLNEKENVTNSRTFDVIKSYEAITRVQSLEQEAQTQKEKLDIIEKKNQELDSFFYQVSHDLKGPISSLIGLNFLAREELSDPQALDYLAHMNDQVRRMNTIIDELIKITKVNHLDDNKT